MSRKKAYLTVYQAGKLTVAGFGDLDNLDQIVVTDCREEIAALIRQHGCEVLAFDLTGIRLVPSGMLGMLASLGRLGVQVYVYNPSDEIREVLEITRLDAVLQIKMVDV